MASSAFKSTTRRGTATEPKAPPPSTAASRRRSHSVSAVSRKTHLPFDNDTSISTEFSNSRDNPLFWVTSSSSSTPPHKEETEKPNKIDTSYDTKSSSSLTTGNSRSGNSNSCVSEERGRSFSRSSGNKNGIGRSLSRVRGRSVSRGAYESEKELGMVTSTSTRSRNVKTDVVNGMHRTNSSEKELSTVISTCAQSRNERTKVVNGINRTGSIRNRVGTQGRVKDAGVNKVQNEVTEWSEDDSACSFQISNLDDGVSMGSFSEAEEKTIKAVCEDLNEFRRNNVKTVKATSIADVPSEVVNPDDLELISDIRREYAIKLEESEERARKLRADLALEEQRGQELDKLLKEILPEPKICAIHRPRRGRKKSNERKRMSNRLTEEAMAYFDECVSLSTFDSSDFSASEDPPYTSLGPSIPIGASSLVKQNCYEQGIHQKQMDSGISSTNERINQQYQFSFVDKKLENTKQKDEDIKSYIKHFEIDKKECKKSSSSYYDGKIESVLVERVLYKSRIESGGLLLCHGSTII